MHENHLCMRKGQFSQNRVFYQLTQHAYIRSIISHFNIIANQLLDHRSNTCALPKVEPHNPIQG